MRLPRLLLPLAGLAVGLGACTDAARGPALVHDGDGFFGSPFPSETRTVDGHPDMTGFPGRESYDLIELYCSEIEQLSGFGTNSAIWLPMDRELDTSILPSPAESATLDSPLLLVDVDERSPARGSLVPFSWAWEEDADGYLPGQVLSIQPLHGAVLHPDRRYAVVLRSSAFRARRGIAEVWEQDHPDHAAWDSLQDVLFQLDLPLDEVADAVFFTTQDPVGQLARWATHARTQVSHPPLDQALWPTAGGSSYQAYEGRILLPQWQEGDSPFTTEGGAFLADEDGVPVLADWQLANFTLSIPLDDAMPADGWPVVIYAHGTGGSHSTFADSTGAQEPASVLARRGLAGIGISMPLHGERGSGADPELLSFNFFNPAAARGNFQQATLDHLYLLEVLSSQDNVLSLLDETGAVDDTALLDPDRIAYLGHSHGGVVGAMAAPFMGDRIRGVFISGAGGGLALAIQLREQGGLDIEQIIMNTFEVEEDEPLIPTHPLAAMVQVLGEAVDPLNYAPYWSARQPFWDSAPVDVLMTTGLLDEHTPSLTSQILAGAGGLPVAAPSFEWQPINELVGLDASLPLSDNIVAWDGSTVTGGLVEFEDEDHFPIFGNGDAIRLYAGYLESALSDDPPVIDAGD